MIRSRDKIFLAVGIATALAYSLPLSAQEIGDAHHGHIFASRYCAECHAVEPGAPSSPNPAAPSFTSVAETSGMNGRALAAWLDSSHPTMPNFVLRSNDRNDVVAYIMSLKELTPK